MPFLVVGGVTVECAADDPPGLEIVEIGDKARMFTGAGRSTRRATKSEFAVTTVPMARADANTLVGILIGTQPVTCSGDLLGASGSYLTAVTKWEAIPVPSAATQHYVVVGFRLEEV